MAANDSDLFGVSLNNFAYSLYHKQAASKGRILKRFAVLFFSFNLFALLGF
jgi:hypothetical protein